MRLLQFTLLTLVLGFGESAFSNVSQGITFIGSEGCFQGDRARTLLTRTLSKHQHKEKPTPKVTVAVSQSATILEVSLRVINQGGGPMLSRSYQLTPRDCPEVPKLIELVLDEALKTLPLEAWASEPIESEGVTESGLRIFFLTKSEHDAYSTALAGGLHYRIWTSADGFYKVLGGFQLGMGPQFLLDQGKAEEMTLLLNLGLQVNFELAKVTLNFTSGAARYQGISTPKIQTTWLPYLESSTEIGFAIGEAIIFGRVASPILRHTVQVEGSSEARSLSPLRLGLGLSLPL